MVSVLNVDIGKTIITMTIFLFSVALSHPPPLRPSAPSAGAPRGTLLLDKPTDDSVEVAVGLTKEVGVALRDVSALGLHAIFERFRAILNEGDLGKRSQYMIEGLSGGRPPPSQLSAPRSRGGQRGVGRRVCVDRPVGPSNPSAPSPPW